MNITLKSISCIFMLFSASSCVAAENRFETKLYGYRCSGDDGHVYSLLKMSDSSYVLYIQKDGSQFDESDITYDGKSVTDIETNGGIGKKTEVEKLFKLMLEGRMSQVGGDYSVFLKSSPSKRCRFTYSYKLSP